MRPTAVGLPPEQRQEIARRLNTNWSRFHIPDERREPQSVADFAQGLAVAAALFGLGFLVGIGEMYDLVGIGVSGAIGTLHPVVREVRRRRARRLRNVYSRGSDFARDWQVAD